MSFDLKNPWGTYRKYELLEDRNAEIYGRQEVTADRIVLLEVIMSAVRAGVPKMNNQMIARYALINYFILYTIREIFDTDGVVAEIQRTRPNL